MGAVAKSVRVFGTGALASLLYLVRCRAVYKAQSNQERPQDERQMARSCSIEHLAV